MLATRGLGRSGTRHSYVVTSGLGTYVVTVVDGRIRVVRIILAAEKVDVRSEVSEAI